MINLQLIPALDRTLYWTCPLTKRTSLPFRQCREKNRVKANHTSQDPIPFSTAHRSEQPATPRTATPLSKAPNSGRLNLHRHLAANLARVTHSRRLNPHDLPHQRP